MELLGTGSISLSTEPFFFFKLTRLFESFFVGQAKQWTCADLRMKALIYFNNEHTFHFLELWNILSDRGKQVTLLGVESL